KEVRQDVRDVGDVVEKFTGDPPGCRGYLPLRRVIVGMGPPSTLADFRGGLCYLDVVEPEPRGPALNWCPSCHGTNPSIWIRLSRVVTAPGERNAATRWKRATGQGSARE